MKRELRSLDRRSMHSIFAPLDSEERLPRELLRESHRFIPYVGETPWKRVVSFLWIPAFLAAVGVLIWVTARF